MDSPNDRLLAVEMLFPGAASGVLNRRSFDDEARELLREALLETEYQRNIGGYGANVVKRRLEERGEYRPKHWEINRLMARISRTMPDARFERLLKSSHLEGSTPIRPDAQQGGPQ